LPENHRKIGNRYEKYAEQYLEEQGYKILERNFRSRSAEIDLIAADQDETIVFIEVKYRKNDMHGLPEEAVTWQKRQRICRAALYYITRHQIATDHLFRFDVIACDRAGLRHYKNAFSYGN
jgi:putative endonuclease